jgi:hypothetical protein
MTTDELNNILKADPLPNGFLPHEAHTFYCENGELKMSTHKMIKTPPLEFWDLFKKTRGAFSTAEALALYNIVSDIKYDGVGDWVEKYAELGSHLGKSSQAIAAALKPQSVFYMVEPEFKDIGWMHRTVDGVYDTNEKIIVIPVEGYSLDFLKVDEVKRLTFVFVDSGTHSDDLVMQESKALEDKIVKGGVICYHDKGSQFTRVDEAFNYLLSTGKFEEIKINWEDIFEYVKWHNLEDGNDSWHQYPELPHPPNFVGALKRK